MVEEEMNRRTVLTAVGALVVSPLLPLSTAGSATATVTAISMKADAKPPLVPSELASFLEVAGDGRVTGYFGKTDLGHGIHTAIAQMIAEELDVTYEQVTVVMGDTATTVNQGGASGSNAVALGGQQMRRAAAEARRVLVEMASERLRMPADQLTVTDGTVHGIREPDKAVSYASLIGGDYFNVQLDWNGQYGNPLVAAGKAKPKPPAQFKVIGRPIPSSDIPAKIFGRTAYTTDVRRPGMLHARMIRPPEAGAVPVDVDEHSIQSIPGARVVRVVNLLAVVADSEWDAVRAASALQVTWSQVAPPFPAMADLYDHIRRAPTAFESATNMFVRQTPVDQSPVEQALARAPRIIEHEYEYPFQSHASMGPAAAVAEVANGKVTVWTGSQKPHFAREGIAKQLGVPVADVRVVAMPGPGSYGRNDAGDASFDAAILAKVTGRPVRVQYMRHDGTGWDPKGPAAVIQMKAGIDESGNVLAHRFKARGFSSWTVLPWELAPEETLAGMWTGAAAAPKDNFGVAGNSYKFPVQLSFFQTVPPLLRGPSPLRTGQFRAPQTPQMLFGQESFMDELAFTAGADPVEFRLRYVNDPRDAAAIRAVAEKAGWERRLKPRLRTRDGLMLGQGMAYTQHSDTTTVALVADIELDPRSGRVWVRRFAVAHDCGLVVNPLGLVRTIEGAVLMATSRALFEEVKFDRRKVTSVDWATYPILEMRDIPEAIDVLVLNRPEAPPSGAGEPATGVVAPAIANAIFDATGRRLRRAPFTAASIRALLG
jgi:CO/xanthine dehydrogenase Mo-binding subunit